MQVLCVRFVRHVVMILMLRVGNWSDKWQTAPAVPNSGKRKLQRKMKSYARKDNDLYR
ncbi:Uncharacterised protein [Mycobacteroides abscessus subsp. abscessus]|nr:Uncharacterised protein [Mycobacteroides abscessus subsp. abscessus]